MTTGVERMPTLKKVMESRFKDEILDILRTRYKLNPGDKEWIGHYQKVSSKMLDSLTGKDREELEKARLQWKKEGPPPEVKYK